MALPWRWASKEEQQREHAESQLSEQGVTTIKIVRQNLTLDQKGSH